MNVNGVVFNTCRPPVQATGWPTNHRGYLTTGEVTLPPNGNPGIVPPWLQAKVVNPTVIGLVPPIDPDTPHIM